MGCSTSVVVSEQTRNERCLSKSTTVLKNTNILNLTCEDKEKIKQSWKLLSNDMLGNGGKILLRLFELNKEIKIVFGLDGLSGKELKNASMFHLQSTRFMQTIGASVDNIDDMEKTMIPVLQQLGRQHFSYDDFVDKLWNPFPEAVLYVWKQELRDRFQPDVPMSWAGLLLLIVSKLKEGYQQACSEDTLKKLNSFVSEEAYDKRL